MPPRKKAYTPKHSAAPDAKTPSVSPDAPGKPGTKGPTETRRRGPQHAANPAKKPGPKPRASSDARSQRAQDLFDEGRAYAYRQAVRSTSGRPSIVGRATAGAAAGTATGAAVGGPPGAAAGAVLGGAGGALAGRKAKKAFDMAANANAGARKIIVAEFLVCITIATLTPLTDRKRDELPTSWAKRMTAIMGLFFILGLISAGGRGPSRFAAGLGGLVTVALALSQRDLFLKIGTIFAGPDFPGGPAGESEGKQGVSVPKPGSGTGKQGVSVPKPGLP